MEPFGCEEIVELSAHLSHSLLCLTSGHRPLGQPPVRDRAQKGSEVWAIYT